MNAFANYSIKVKNINFDTTSKVMWGQYDAKSTEGEMTEQIKIGLGAANGIVVDGKVLSGNMDNVNLTEDNLNEAESRKIALITSLPGTSTFAKDIKDEAIANFKKVYPENKAH